MVPLISGQKTSAIPFHSPFTTPPTTTSNILYPSFLATHTHFVEIYKCRYTRKAKEETPEELLWGMHCQRFEIPSWHSVSPEFCPREGPREKKSIRKYFLRGCDPPNDSNSGEKRVWHEPKDFARPTNEWTSGRWSCEENDTGNLIKKVILSSGVHLFPSLE